MENLHTMKIIKNLPNILLGTFRNVFRIRPNYYKRRYSICKRCEYIKKAKGFGEYCDICGCIVKSKVSVKSETCYLGKW